MATNTPSQLLVACLHGVIVGRSYAALFINALAKVVEGEWKNGRANECTCVSVTKKENEKEPVRAESNTNEKQITSGDAWERKKRQNEKG